LAIASIDPDTLATCASALPTAPSLVSIRPTASISSAICLTAVSTAARDWVISPTAAVGRRLHRLRGVGDIVVGGDHRLGGLLQMSEPLRLGGNAVSDLLHIAGDVGELDPEAADPVRELIDQPLARRGLGRSRLQVRWLCVHSLYAVRKPPQCRPLTRIGTSISRIITVLPLPMSRA
jgi:hypothetical protein